MVSLALLAMGTMVPCGVQPEPVRVRMGLYSNFRKELSPAVREVLKEEVAAIVIPIGVLVDWRSPRDSERERWRTGVASVTFKGHCVAADLWPRPPHPWVFGQTQVIDGQVIPYADVHCDEIRAALGAELVSAAPRRRSLVFGRAISRVVTHELHHILTKTKGHGAGGITKWSYTTQDLMSDQFRLVDREVATAPGSAAVPSEADSFA